MKQSSVDWLVNQMLKQGFFDGNKPLSYTTLDHLQNQAKEIHESELKDAYKHGRDDENCALSDGAMAPDYDNADDWFKGEYGGDK